jgi:hypothetical protein
VSDRGLFVSISLWQQTVAGDNQYMKIPRHDTDIFTRCYLYGCRLGTLLMITTAIAVEGGLSVQAADRRTTVGNPADADKDSLARSEAAAKIESHTGAFTICCQNLKSPNDIFIDLRKVNDPNEALKFIASYVHVGALILKDTGLTDAGMKHLSALQNLQTLDLTGTKITDAGLVRLKGLTHLRFLELGETKITDAGLRQLEGLKELESLSLSKTKVTAAGIAELQKALPKCGIGQ